MPYRSNSSEFTRYWTRLQSWAEQNKIPKSALLPVYHMDVQRLMHTGQPMSEGERYRAVEAAAGRNPQAMPTTFNRPSNVMGNVVHTLQSIFTGLNPVGLVHNFYDSIKNTIEHPLSALDALTGTKKQLAAITQHPTKSIFAEFVPGVLDAMKLEQGSKGIATLAAHPVSSLLDVMSFSGAADMLTKFATGGDIGDAIASKMGITREELGSTSVYRNLGKLVGSKTNKLSRHYHLGFDKNHNPVYSPETISDTLTRWSSTHGIGGKISKLMYGALSISQRYTHISQETLGELNDAMKKLTPEERQMIPELLTKSGRSIDDLIHTHSIPQAVQGILNIWQPIQQHIEEYALSTGKVVEVTLPTGKKAIYNSHVGNYLQQKSAAVDESLQKFDRRRQEAAQVDLRANNLNKQIFPLVSQLSNAQKSIWSYITQTLPSMPREDIRNTLRQTLTPTHRWDTGTISHFNKDRIYRMAPVKRSRQELEDLRKQGHPVETIEKGIAYRKAGDIQQHHADTLKAVFGPGGLIDQISHHLTAKHWPELRDTILKAQRRMDGQYAKELTIDKAPQMFNAIRTNLHTLYTLSQERARVDKEFQNILIGTTVKGKRESVATLEKNWDKAQQEFEQAVTQRPPDSYVPMLLDIFTKKLFEHEDATKVIGDISSELRNKGYTKEQLNELHQNPRILSELISTISNSTYSDPIIGKAFGNMGVEVMNEAKQELATLRAQGFTPEWVPNITIDQMKAEGYDTYNVFIRTTRTPTLSHALERTFNYGTSVNNFLAGVTHAVKDQLQHQGTLEYHKEFVLPHTYKYTDIEKLIHATSKFRARLADITNPDTRGAIMDGILKELGLRKWNPDEFFNLGKARTMPGADEQLLIPQHIAHALTQITHRDQFPMNGLWDKATNLFRFSILGLSPRFTLHIAVGGTYLLALRTNPAIFRYLPEAYRLVKSGTLPDDVAHALTQEGNAYIAYHHMAGRTAGRWALQEELNKLGIDPKYASIADYLHAAMNINFRFTRFVGNMQRALAFFDGMNKVGKLQFITDENGKRWVNTSSQRAYYEGLKSVHRVMGDLRYMSPFERHWVTRALPFYGWTKHVLNYVLTMPVDHPLRAQILSNMAEANSDSVGQNLPMRIQLLLFLGQPDINGNVTAITDRYADPLRTVANYASLSGWLSALNPIIMAPFAKVDPEMVYGTNSLYPQVQYTQVFGVRQGGQGGSAMTSLEQIVPELGSLDVAFGLSQQYRHLSQTTPQAFKKDIYESLNIPFFNIQHLNLKQIAAKQAIDKYETAKAAATTAITTGTFTQLSGYKTVPYPINDVYNITPKQLELMYQEAMTQYGLPLAAVAQPPRSPSLL